MRRLDTLCGGGLLLLLFQVAAAAFSAEPVVEVTTDALHVIAAPDSGRRIIAAENDELTVRDLFTLATVAELPALERPRTAAAISGDGNFVAIGDGSGRFAVWQVADPPIPVAKFKHLSGITGLQLSHNGQHIAVASLKGLVVRAVDGSRSWVLPVGAAQSFKLSADGRQISAHGRLWDVASRRRLEPPHVAYHYVDEDSALWFVEEVADDSPDRQFELGDWVVAVKRQTIDDRNYCVVRLFDAKPSSQRAVLLFEDDVFPSPDAKQLAPVELRADITDGVLTVSTWNSSTLRRWRTKLSQALAAGEQFAVAFPRLGQWQGIARWNSQADVLTELQRLKNWPRPRVADKSPASHVNFSGSLLRNDDFAQLAPVKGLTSLRLDGCQFDNASLIQLQSLPWLETLTIGESCRIDQDGLPALSALPKLTTLKFERYVIPPKWFTALGSCQQLRVLRTRFPAAEQTFAEIMKLKQLEELPELGCCISAENVEQLTRMTSLRTLNLAHARISDGQLEAVAGLRHLEALTLHVDIDARHAEAPLELLHGVRRVLSAATPLRTLLPGSTPAFPDGSSVRPTMFDRHGLAPVAQFTHLKRLRLSGNGVTNNGMQHVAGVRQLRHLDLTGCVNVSDDSLKSLATLKELRTLKLEKTSVSESGVAEIKKALPKCVVSW